jgi:hypothetical protein
MPETYLIPRERALLRELASLVEYRGKTETELVERMTAGRGGAESAFAEAQKRVQTLSEKEQGSIREEFEGRIAASKGKFDSDLTALRRAMDAQLGQFNEKTSKIGKAAKKRLAESQWLIETVVESGESKIRSEYELGKKLLASRGGALDQMETAAGRLLEEGRHAALPEIGRVEVEGNGKLFAAYEEAKGDVSKSLAGLAARVNPRGLSLGAIIVLAAIAAGGAAGASWALGRADVSWLGKLIVATLLAVLLVAICIKLAMRKRVPVGVASFVAAMAKARSLADRCAIRLEEERAEKLAEVKARRAKELKEATDAFEVAKELVNRRMNDLMPRLRDRHAGRSSRVRQTMSAALAALDKEYREAREGSDRRRDAALADATSRRDGKITQLEEEDRAGWTELVRVWREGMTRLHAERESLATLGDSQWPDWHAASWAKFEPPATVVPAARFGRIEVDMAAMTGGLPRDPRLAVPGPTKFQLPALSDLMSVGSMLIQAGPEGRDAAIALVKDVMLRLLTSLPPGKARFTIVDPVGLGESFAGFMHLADFEEALVSDRIWTDARHIEQKLTDLTEHMETVIQKYLRNEYETIQAYNAEAGEVAEPYRFLVIADFPANITDTAAKKLASIVSSGPRCGVYTIIASDLKKPPAHVPMAAIERESIVLRWEKAPPGGAGGQAASGTGTGGAWPRFVYKDEDFGRWPLESEWPPAEDELTRLLTEVGTLAKDSTRVQVPFAMVSPANGEVWSLDTAEEIRVPLGRAGAKKLQYLSLGRGTTQHALIAGRTGSGKSTLLHVLVTNLALWYGPDQVEFYLVDFKKGVEFKTYATHALPHARVIAVESEREFGLSVLRKLDAELTRRGELFRAAGVQDMAGYRRFAASEPGRPGPGSMVTDKRPGAGTPRLTDALPRILLIVDEFQEFFVEDDKIAQEASLLMDRLVRQGRAFGMHVVLGSQTLGGAYSIARSTIGQMAVRIALQCSEADSYLIMSEDNAAARLLSRPGEAIYNDASGNLEGNSPFQIVWLPEPTRDEALQRARGMLEERGMPAPPEAIVFEGNVPADIRRCTPLARLLSGTGGAPQLPTAWLGEAISIKDPTSLNFGRHSGSNALVVGHQEEAALSTLQAAAIGLASWTAAKGAMQADSGVPQFVLLDGTPVDSSHAGMLSGVFGKLPVAAKVGGVRQAPGLIADLHEELERRNASESHDFPPVFLFIAGLQRFRDLKRGDDFGFSGDDTPSAGKQFSKLLADGPAVAMHTIVWCDTATNVERMLDRSAMREFDARILFQMSQNDSTQLIDTPVASSLGRHRAVLSRAEQGVLEKFRPYSPADPAWVDGVMAKLRERAAKRERVSG